MKIERPSRTDRAQGLRGKSAYAGQARGPASASGEITAVQDAVSILGIPEAELTPKVREAIASLVDEVLALRQEVKEARRAFEDIRMLADQDALVPVFNRRAFLREMSRLMAYVERYDGQAALIYLDLNGFKEINDSFGHAAGDAVLRGVADILSRSVRASDMVGRLGGDEFGVLLANSDLKSAGAKAERLVDDIRNHPTEWKGHAIHVGLSFGVYAINKAEDPDEALAAADIAMYANKTSRADR